jgi:NADH dehydrogenase FAD-containing subunit
VVIAAVATVVLTITYLSFLRKSRIEIILNKRVANTVSLKDGTIIPTKTIIRSGGVAPSSLLTSISCEHDHKSGRITVDKYLLQIQRITTQKTLLVWSIVDGKVY